MNVNRDRYSPCKQIPQTFVTQDKSDKRNAAKYAKAEQIDRENHMGEDLATMISPYMTKKPFQMSSIKEIKEVKLASETI